MEIPDLAVERTLFAQGYRLIAGLDEVGRGAWAGPVVAAAVILPLEQATLQADLQGVRDSKLLTPSQREVLAQRIYSQASAVGIGWVPNQDIDGDGIVAATRQAMHLALAALPIHPDYLVIDALTLPKCPIPQLALIRGDSQCLAIAAASIVAKVARDHWMAEQESVYPGYGFAQHRGYGTSAHQEALAQLGPCPLHRMSFAPLRRGEEMDDDSLYRMPSECSSEEEE